MKVLFMNTKEQKKLNPLLKREFSWHEKLEVLQRVTGNSEYYERLSKQPILHQEDLHRVESEFYKLGMKKFSSKADLQNLLNNNI